MKDSFWLGCLRIDCKISLCINSSYQDSYTAINTKHFTFDLSVKPNFIIYCVLVYIFDGCVCNIFRQLGTLSHAFLCRFLFLSEECKTVKKSCEVEEDTTTENNHLFSLRVFKKLLRIKVSSLFFRSVDTNVGIYIFFVSLVTSFVCVMNWLGIVDRCLFRRGVCVVLGPV